MSRFFLLLVLLLGLLTISFVGVNGQSDSSSSSDTTEEITSSTTAEEDTSSTTSEEETTSSTTEEEEPTTSTTSEEPTTSTTSEEEPTSTTEEETTSEAIPSSSEEPVDPCDTFVKGETLNEDPTFTSNTTWTEVVAGTAQANFEYGYEDGEVLFVEVLATGASNDDLQLKQSVQLVAGVQYRIDVTIRSGIDTSRSVDVLTVAGGETEPFCGRHSLAFESEVAENFSICCTVQQTDQVELILEFGGTMPGATRDFYLYRFEISAEGQTSTTDTTASGIVDPPSSDDEGISGGAIAAIIIVVVAVIIACILAIILFVKFRDDEKSSSEEMQQTNQKAQEQVGESDTSSESETGSGKGSGKSESGSGSGSE